MASHAGTIAKRAKSVKVALRLLSSGEPKARAELFPDGELGDLQYTGWQNRFLARLIEDELVQRVGVSRSTKYRAALHVDPKELANLQDAYIVELLRRSTGDDLKDTKNPELDIAATEEEALRSENQDLVASVRHMGDLVHALACSIAALSNRLSAVEEGQRKLDRTVDASFKLPIVVDNFAGVAEKKLLTIHNDMLALVDLIAPIYKVIVGAANGSKMPNAAIALQASTFLAKKEEVGG